ncbi:MAG TPA: cation diffusion facilitator family transporter [Acidimicrobiales bacterium]|nr:cation diffusion facilitator family transporter [Acidimicrobiales bacterium]
MTRSRRLAIALALNVALVVAQVVFGLLARSLGLLADAGHNLSDVAAVMASLVAVRWARRAPTATRSFGYHRGTILAALANAAMIIAVSGWIAFEGIRRLGAPQPVRGGVVLAVALVAFAANALAALVLRDGGTDLNMRAALLHMAGDAAASLGVAAAGLVILATGRFLWLDPAMSMAIGGLIAVEAVQLVRQATEVLLESTPNDVNLRQLTATIGDVDGVETVHDLHVWSLSSEVRALSAHVVLAGHPSLEQAQVVGDRIKRAVAAPFAIAHSTLELECEPCGGEAPGPCGMAEVPTGAGAVGEDARGRESGGP